MYTSLALSIHHCLSIQHAHAHEQPLLLPELVGDALHPVEEVAVLRADDLIGARDNSGFAENAVGFRRCHGKQGERHTPQSELWNDARRGEQ